MDEPVADMLRGVLDGHVVLERVIAERGRFPPIDVLRSVSRSLPQAASAEENRIIARARALLGTYARAELMIQAGLYERGSDPETDAAIAAWPRLDAFVAASAPDGIAASFETLRLACDGDSGRSAPLAEGDAGAA
jgi:flagellum-specific ATP synthase